MPKATNKTNKSSGDAPAKLKKKSTKPKRTSQISNLRNMVRAVTSEQNKEQWKSITFDALEDLNAVLQEFVEDVALRCRDVTSKHKTQTVGVKQIDFVLSTILSRCAVKDDDGKSLFDRAQEYCDEIMREIENGK